MESSDRNLRPRPPKARKKRRKHSSPVESPSPAAPVPPTEKNTQIKDSIRVRRPQRPTTPTNSLFTPTDFNFSPPRFPALWEGPQYLLMLNRALQLTMRALQLHSTEYANPTNKQIQERRFIDQIHQSLEKLTTGQLEEDMEVTVVSPAVGDKEREKETRLFVDASTTTTLATTTTEHISLCDRIQSLEDKLDKLFTKPSYASAVQQNKAPSPPTVAPSQIRASRHIQLEDTRFVVEVEDAVPENFNPLPLRETLNALLPKGCPRFTAIRRSRKGNLICYTLGNPIRTINAFDIWASAVPFRATRVNAEDKCARRILYLSHPCTSAASLDSELRQFNPELQLATIPRLLTPTVALLLFPSEQEAPHHVFAFATYRRLASYVVRTTGEVEHAKGRREKKGKERENEVEKETEQSGKEEREAKEIAASWATQMEECEGEERGEEEENEITEVVMEETSQN